MYAHARFFGERRTDAVRTKRAAMPPIHAFCFGGCRGIVVANDPVMRSFILCILLMACSSADDPEGGGGAGGSGGNAPDPVSCQQACARVEQVCPDLWASVDECADTCVAEPFSQASLDCAVTADDCDDVDVCSD